MLGLFFYKSDTQEIDIEYVSSPPSAAGNDRRPKIPPYIQFTNQPRQAKRPDQPYEEHFHMATCEKARYCPADSTVRVHEYRIDWTDEKTLFYIDGVLHKTITVNVPDQPGNWIWNNWTNGGRGFTGGPPAGDSIMRIKDITMYFNTAGS